jgi:hypothetical protein
MGGHLFGGKMRKGLIILALVFVSIGQSAGLDESFVDGAKLYKAVEIEHLMELNDLSCVQAVNYFSFVRYVMAVTDACQYLTGHNLGDSVTYPDVYAEVANDIVMYDKIAPGQNPNADAYWAVITALNNNWPEAFNKIIAQMKAVE